MGQSTLDSLSLRFPALWAAMPRTAMPGTASSIPYPNAREAFFCRQERKWEQATGLPMKFRLGSWEQAQWLEGKARTHLPYP